jgi:hypothetical protein
MNCCCKTRSLSNLAHCKELCDELWKTRFFFLWRSAICYSNWRNNSTRCLLRRLPRPQYENTPSKSTCHLSAHPSKYYSGPRLLDLGDQMCTGTSNVARRGSPIWKTFQRIMHDILTYPNLHIADFVSIFLHLSLSLASDHKRSIGVTSNNQDKF